MNVARSPGDCSRGFSIGPLASASDAGGPVFLAFLSGTSAVGDALGKEARAGRGGGGADSQRRAHSES